MQDSINFSDEDKRKVAKLVIEIEKFNKNIAASAGPNPGIIDAKVPTIDVIVLQNASEIRLNNFCDYLVNILSEKGASIIVNNNLPEECTLKSKPLGTVYIIKDNNGVIKERNGFYSIDIENFLKLQYI